MKQVIDERVRLPRAVQHILFMLFGISGIALITRGHIDGSYIDSLLLLVTSIHSGLASYGAFCLIHDLKKARSIKSFLKDFINKFEITFYDNNRNSN